MEGGQTHSHVMDGLDERQVSPEVEGQTGARMVDLDEAQAFQAMEKVEHPLKRKNSGHNWCALNCFTPKRISPRD